MKKNKIKHGIKKKKYLCVQKNITTEILHKHFAWRKKQ